MAGTSSTPIFVKEGQYLSLVADNAITLGNVVKLTSTGTDTCDVAGVASGAPSVIGVAVGGDRFSRTATDDQIAAGARVTVCTRGIVRVYTGTSTIVRGSFLEAAASGTVDLLGTTAPVSTTTGGSQLIGIALDGNSGAATTIRMLLMRG